MPFSHAFNKNNQAIELKTTPATVIAVTQSALSHAKKNNGINHRAAKKAIKINNSTLRIIHSACACIHTSALSTIATFRANRYANAANTIVNNARNMNT